MNDSGDYRTILFGPEGLHYVLARLSEGHTLARALMRRVENTRGLVSTTLPAHIPDDMAREFDEGILDDPPEHTHINYHDAKGQAFRIVPKPNTDQVSVDRIIEFLSERPTSLCLLEEHSSVPTGAWFKAWGGRLWTYESEVYHVLTASEKARDVVFRSVRAAQSWTFLGALADCPHGIERDPLRRATSQQELADLCESTTTVLVGAYKNEGCLFWTSQEGRSS